MMPFFAAHAAAPASGGLPLGIIAGGLILDSGEAERTFIFRCQDRYLAYNTLAGLRTVLFVADDVHVAHYRRELETFDRHLAAIAAATGVVPARAPEPLFVTCDLDRLKLGVPWALRDQLRRGLVSASEPTALYLNQLSPTYAELVGQLGALLRDLQCPVDVDREACARTGELALRFHNKARHAELIAAHAGEDLPRHVPTAVISAEQFLSAARYQDLVRLYVDATGDHPPASMFVKSAQDSSGNVAARMCEQTFDVTGSALRREVEQQLLSRRLDVDERMRHLRSEVDAAPTLRPLALSDDRLRRYKRLQAERRTGIEVLLQREVTPPADLAGRFASVGLSFDLRGPEHVTPIAVAAQLYRDADLRSYAGSYLSPAVTAGVLRGTFGEQMVRLCRLFAAQGYRGPINFDARLAADGQYELIHDCNPRLTAIYPPMAVQGALRAQGLPADEVVGIGYRGELASEDLPGWLAELSRRELLYTPARPRGAVILPNLSRRHGFDAVFVNLAPAAVLERLRSGAFGPLERARLHA